MKTSLFLVATLAILPATFVHAQGMKMSQGDMKAMPAATEMTPGEVRKIDATTSTIVIKHGPLKSLGMPGMTMEFGVKPPTLLKQVKVGDKIHFVAEMVNGVPTVTKIEQAK